VSRPGARGRPVKRPLGAGDYVQQMRRAGDAPDAPWQPMLSQARSHLLCGKLRDRAGMLRRAAALTSQDIATAMTGLRRQMIMVTPQALPAVRARMPRLRATPAAAVTGTSYPARGGPMRYPESVIGASTSSHRSRNP